MLGDSFWAEISVVALVGIAALAAALCRWAAGFTDEMRELLARIEARAAALGAWAPRGHGTASPPAPATTEVAADTELRDVSLRLDALQEEHAAARKELEQARAAREELNAELRQLTEANKAQQAQLGQQQQLVATLRKTVKQLTERVELSEGERKQLTASLKQAESQNGAANERLDELKCELADTAAESESLRAELEQARQAFGQIRSALAAARSRAEMGLHPAAQKEPE